ncbi:MAG: ABC transporter ATP-binding protein [Fimbriimonadaceae bacterium]|nr:ABC transporter ATP-binding protein [Fimbriimonadaceae bacterium]
MAVERCLEATGVSKQYTDFWGRPTVLAVEALDLVVAPGEVVGLLGPNGSGKSTTVKMLVDLLRPSRGSIRLFGRSPRDPLVKARLGYLPEESCGYPYLTGLETLHFYGRLQGLDGSRLTARVATVLDEVGLRAGRERRVGQYSKGMQRRLGLAQALLGQPALLLLDEPTSGLDPLGRRDVKALIRRLAAAGSAVLLSSHLLAEVEDVCDRLLILHRGRTLASGAVGDLLRQPQGLRATLPQLAPERAAELLAAIRPLDEAATTEPLISRLEAYFLAVVAAAGAEGRDA